MAMNAGFPDWYRAASVTPPEGLLEKRWAGVVDVAAKTSREGVLPLARLFSIPSSGEADVPAGFREAFRAHDDTFGSRDNIQELRVLAGAVLRQFLEVDASVATSAALALQCAAFATRLATVPEREHVEAAGTYLVKRGRRIRDIQAGTGTAIASLKLGIPNTLKTDAFSGALSVLQEPLVNVLTAVETGVNAGLAAAQKGLRQLEQVVQVQREELNILWWLQTAFSRDLSEPFEAVGYLAGVEVFPMELADLTTLIPGPDVVTGVLLQALSVAGAPDFGQRITLFDATNATPRDWREQARQNYTLEQFGTLCPVLLAISKSLDTEGQDEWVPVYRKACDISVNEEIPMMFLALQLYHERLLIASVTQPL